MTFIPNFLLKRIYVAGSFRKEPDGLSFELKNSMGPGSLTRIEQVKIAETVYKAPVISLVNDSITIEGADVSDETPLNVKLGESLRLHVNGPALAVGSACEIALTVVSKEAGRVTVTVQDTLAEA